MALIASLLGTHCVGVGLGLGVWGVIRSPYDSRAQQYCCSVLPHWLRTTNLVDGGWIEVLVVQ